MANRGNHSRKKPGGAANAVKGVLVACMLLVLFAAGSTLFKSDDARSPGIAATPPVSATGGGQGDTIDVTTGDNNTPPAGTAQPTAPSTVPSTAPSTAPRPGGNWASDIGRSIAVPESEAVDDSYFDDAIFIGDSRTDGLKMYSGLPVSCFWSEVGLTVTKCFQDRFVVLNGQYLTVGEALEQADYSKVYIMLGMNELGWVYESEYAKGYARIIDVIQSTHPDAEIYVQSIIPVSKWLNNNPEANRGYNTMANVIRLQKALVEMVNSKEGVHYVNVAECMEDNEGYLFSDATEDGLHLNATYCKIWMQYLRTHTV